MIDDDERVYTIVCFKCRKPFQLADPYLQVRAYGDVMELGPARQQKAGALTVVT